MEKGWIWWVQLGSSQLLPHFVIMAVLKSCLGNGCFMCDLLVSATKFVKLNDSVSSLLLLVFYIMHSV